MDARTSRLRCALWIPWETKRHFTKGSQPVHDVRHQAFKDEYTTNHESRGFGFQGASNLRSHLVQDASLKVHPWVLSAEEAGELWEEHLVPLNEILKVWRFCLDAVVGEVTEGVGQVEGIVGRRRKPQHPVFVHECPNCEHRRKTPLMTIRLDPGECLQSLRIAHDQSRILDRIRHILWGQEPPLPAFVQPHPPARRAE